MQLLFATEGPVAFVTFNRPEARNAMTWDMYDALVSACERADSDPDLRALVLRSAGTEAFIAGTDIGQFAGFRSGEDGVAYERRIDAVIDRLERVSVPTIAEVQGVAAGGGCAIAFACDFRVCTPNARFGVPIARTLGNCLSAANYARFVDLIGPARTKDLIFTGRFLDASEAMSLGLITHLVEPQRLSAATQELTSVLVANAPLTLRTTKEALRRISALRRPLAADLDDFVARCYGSDDFREGVASFLEKRRPRFTGR